VAASGEQERLARFAGGGTAAASGGSSAIACVRGSALYLLWFPARLVVVPRSVTGRRWTRRQDWRGGVRKLLALELARRKGRNHRTRRGASEEHVRNAPRRRFSCSCEASGGRPCQGRSSKGTLL